MAQAPNKLGGHPGQTEFLLNRRMGEENGQGTNPELLDCYWVGSLGSNCWEIKGFSELNQQKVKNFLRRGRCSNQDWCRPFPCGRRSTCGASSCTSPPAMRQLATQCVIFLAMGACTRPLKWGCPCVFPTGRQRLDALKVAAFRGTRTQSSFGAGCR